MNTLTNLSEAIETICDMRLAGAMPQKTMDAYHIMVPDNHTFLNITEQLAA
jgi:hypothetical protein